MKIETVEHTPMKILLEDYYFIYYKTGKLLKISRGFAYDGISVPQLFSWIFKPNDNDKDREGLEHDFLYSELCKECTIRKDADLHFVHDMIPIWTKILAYLGVRSGGWKSFKKDTNYKKYRKQIKAKLRYLKIKK